MAIAKKVYFFGLFSECFPTQGKYVPPERTDGLLPQEKIVLEALKVAETEEEGAKEAKKEAEEVVEEVVEAPAADIDLD